MTELKYAILSEQAIINRETGQISIINTLNGLNVPKLPIEVNTIFLTMSWQREVKDSENIEAFRIRIFLESPSMKGRKKTLDANEEFEVKLPKGNFVANTITRLNVQFTEDGENRFVIERKHNDSWKQEVVVPVNIIVTSRNSST